MKKIPWIKEFPNDELQIIATLPLAERGAYFSLKLIYHTNIEAFENEKILFAMCLAFSKEEKNIIRKIVKKHFCDENKKPFNTRLNLLEQEVERGIKQRINAGKKSGEARKNKKDNNLFLEDSDSDSEYNESTESSNIEPNEKQISIEEFKKLEFDGDFLEMAQSARLPENVAQNCWDKWKAYRAANPPTDLLANWAVWALNERFTSNDHKKEKNNINQEGYSEKEQFINKLGNIKWTLNQSKKGNGMRQPSDSDIKMLNDFEKNVKVVDWRNLEDFKKKIKQKMLQDYRSNLEDSLIRTKKNMKD